MVRYLLLLIVITGVLQGGERYLGSKNCATCHTKIYDKWGKTTHGSPKSKLTTDQLKNPRCSGCHAPVKGEHAIGCEGCHGAGGDYARSFIMKDPLLRQKMGLKKVTPETCSRCHNRYAYRRKRVDFEIERFKVCGHGITGKKGAKQIGSTGNEGMQSHKPQKKRDIKNKGKEGKSGALP